MSNSLVNGNQVASAMLGGLVDAGVLINACYRDAESEIVAGKGQTISVRRPVTGIATSFTGTATVSDHDEDNISLTLDVQPYEQIKLSAREKSLNVEDFYPQVVAPRLAGIAEYIDSVLADVLGTTTTTAVTGATAAAAATAGFAALGDAKVPMSDRFLACSPTFAAALLADKALISADARSDMGAAMQEATLGRIYGFTVLVSSYVADAFAFHRNGLVAAFRTPDMPVGGATGSTAAAFGLSARVVSSWDNTKLADVLTVDTLCGFALGGSAYVVPVAID